MLEFISISQPKSKVFHPFQIVHVRLQTFWQNPQTNVPACRLINDSQISGTNGRFVPEILSQRFAIAVMISLSIAYYVKTNIFIIWLWTHGL
jgi:hypothetical protein